MLRRIPRKIRGLSYPAVETLFRSYENVNASRGKVLEKIPPYKDRMGGLGTTTYGEWCYTIGIFQTLIHTLCPDSGPIRMLDVGCGAGRLYLAAQASFRKGDTYTGLDVEKQSIDICQQHYGSETASFVHYEANNAYYAPGQSAEAIGWPFDDNAFNVLTALSVWTHLKEEDWIYYLGEVARVLQPGGRALISFFILDEDYEAALPQKTAAPGKYYPQPRNRWIFDTPVYGSKDWFAPKWASTPELAIGVTKAAFDKAVAGAGLKVDRLHPGSWKDRPAHFFQDLVELSHI